MKFLSIDPSVNNVGFAIMQEGKWQWGTWHPPKADIITVCEYLGEMVAQETPDVLIMEYPTFMVAQRGIISAQRGYTIDLGTICGYLACASNLPSDSIFIYTPNQWKGQMKKHMVQFRFLRKFGQQYKNVSDHAYEATMMLDFHLRKHYD